MNLFFLTFFIYKELRNRLLRIIFLIINYLKFIFLFLLTFCEEVFMNNFWDRNCFKVFLSHTFNQESKQYVSQLKQELKFYGISCFVAHEDIYPNQEWQDKIKQALHQMDGFIALLTKDFHNNFWTDQEVGFAVCRKVPIISVKIESDPKGFISIFQAVINNDNVSTQIAQSFIKNDKMIDPYIKAIENCTSWDNGNRLSKLLSSIGKLSENQKERLRLAFNDNNEISGSFGFAGDSRYNNGKNLVDELNRLSPESSYYYAFNFNGSKKEIVKIDITSVF